MTIHEWQTNGIDFPPDSVLNLHIQSTTHFVSGIIRGLCTTKSFFARDSKEVKESCCIVGSDWGWQSREMAQCALIPLLRDQSTAYTASVWYPLSVHVHFHVGSLPSVAIPSGLPGWYAFHTLMVPSALHDADKSIAPSVKVSRAKFIANEGLGYGHTIQIAGNTLSVRQILYFVSLVEHILYFVSLLAKKNRFCCLMEIMNFVVVASR